METKKNMPMLELMLRPAFCVADGRITGINQAAAHLLLSEGMDILPLLATGKEEYQAFEKGCLYLSLAIGPQSMGATVVCAEDCHLFLLDQPSDTAELRAFALAAQQLRGPLSGISAVSSRLDTAAPEQLAQLNHRMHQLMRIVSNMSDAVQYCETKELQLEGVELCAFLEELLSKTALQLETARIRLIHTLPNAPVYTLVDREKVERAVYNMLCNAAKHTCPGGSIRFEFVCRGRLYLSVTDEGYGANDVPPGNVYTRYLRTPSVTDGLEGIGLGMVLVRATAALHGGTVLIDHPQEKGTRVTMTLPLRKKGSMQIRSPQLRIDYAGERDHGLQELADVLPASLYTPDKL